MSLKKSSYPTCGSEGLIPRSEEKNVKVNLESAEKFWEELFSGSTLQLETLQ